jgi:hypothetical protein
MKRTDIKLIFFILLILILSFNYLSTNEILCDDQIVYQAYNQGLQETSCGYRYELGGGSGNININATNYTMDGKPVYMEYIGVDINGNPIYNYTYPTSLHTTQLGEIEPVPTEVINNAYYQGGGYIKPLDTSNPTLKRRVYNKIKIGIKNHIAKSNDEYIRQERIRTESMAKRFSEYKKVAKVH